MDLYKYWFVKLKENAARVSLDARGNKCMGKETA